MYVLSLTCCKGGAFLKALLMFFYNATPQIRCQAPRGVARALLLGKRLPC